MELLTMLESRGVLADTFAVMTGAIESYVEWRSFRGLATVTVASSPETKGMPHLLGE
jgi:hypothetical protein